LFNRFKGGTERVREKLRDLGQQTVSAEPDFKPFVPADQKLPEFTPLPLIVGAVLGIIFAWSSAYLGLKVGQTVSASIPVAVLSITIFRWLAKTLRIRQATILENNMAQTVGSAGESLAAGIVF